jgi:hypothetical protein
MPCKQENKQRVASCSVPVKGWCQEDACKFNQSLVGYGDHRFAFSSPVHLPRIIQHNSACACVLGKGMQRCIPSMNQISSSYKSRMPTQAYANSCTSANPHRACTTSLAISQTANQAPTQFCFTPSFETSSNTRSPQCNGRLSLGMAHNVELSVHKGHYITHA